MDTNRSKSENQLDRLRRKIVKTRYKLFKGNDREYHDLFNPAYYFSKPKGMSRKRFDIEQNTLANIEDIYWRNANDYIDRLMSRLVKK